MADLDKVADELYAVHPDQFARARDEAIKKAKDVGQPALAKELAALRKPTLSAWLVNQLWRDQREAIEELFEVGAGMTSAQEQGDGRKLRDLMDRRRETEAALLKRAPTVAEKAKVTVTAAMTREVQETISAALALPEVAAEVRSGRLVKPAEYAGFGGSVAVPAKIIQLPRRAKEQSAAKPAVDAKSASKRVAETRAALDATAKALDSATRAAEKAHDEHRELRKQLEELRERVRTLQVQAVAAESTEIAAERRRDQLEQTHEVALKEHQRAEKELTGK